MREEGVSSSVVSDSRVEMALDEATRFIDRVTGWFFEPREMTISLDGNGAPTIETPVPCIELEHITESEEQIDVEEVEVIGAPVQYGDCYPRLRRTDDHVFPAGRGNVVVSGVWGYTEEDGSRYGRTPLEIRRACLLLAMRLLPKLGDLNATNEARNRWRVIEEKTRDQSYKLKPLGTSVGFTGDPEIDGILIRYSRPFGMGAA